MPTSGFIVFLGWMAFAPSPGAGHEYLLPQPEHAAAASQESVPSEKQISDTLKSAWARVSNVSLEFSLMTIERKAGSPASSLNRVVLSGGGQVIFCDSKYGFVDDPDQFPFRRVVFYDSRTDSSGTFQIRGKEGGWTEKGKTPEADTILMGLFFSVNAHHMLHLANARLPSYTLSEIFKSEWGVVRPKRETREGISCVVVDVLKPTVCLKPKEDGSQVRRSEVPPGTKEFKSVTLWLDPDRGYLPVRQEHYDENGKTYLEVSVQAASKIDETIWIATEASWKVSAYPPDGAVTLRIDLTQARWTHFEPQRRLASNCSGLT